MATVLTVSSAPCTLELDSGTLLELETLLLDDLSWLSFPLDLFSLDELLSDESPLEELDDLPELEESFLLELEDPFLPELDDFFSSEELSGSPIFSQSLLTHL
jgi:hypothetical protein